ncbi:MAG: hypothetical protein ACOY94_16655 [Bacillota bacterium]
MGGVVTLGAVDVPLAAGFLLEKEPNGLEKLRLPLENDLESGEVYVFESVDVAGGGLVEKERDGEVEGAGVVTFGLEKEREGDGIFGADLGTEKDRLPELKPRPAPEKPRFANAGEASTPNVKTTITTRARMRLTQVQGRMVPHPPGCFASLPLPRR